MLGKKHPDFSLTEVLDLVRINVRIEDDKPLYNRGNMARKFLPGDRKSLDYGGKFVIPDSG